MKKPSSLKINYIYNTLFQIVLIISPIITTPYVARVLGADGVGEFSFFSAMVTYFVLLANLGSTTFGQRSVAYNRDNRESLSFVFWDTVAFRVFSSLIAIVAYILYLIVTGNNTFLGFVFILNIINVLFDFSWLFQGLEDFKKIAFRNLIIRIISIVAIFTLVKTPNDVWLYATILSLSTLLGSLSLFPSVLLLVDRPKRIKPFAHIKEMFLLFLPTVAIQIYAVLDKSMLGFISNSYYENGCYEQSEKIARMALTVVTSVGTVVLPRISNLFAKRDYNKIRECLYSALKIVWLLSLPIVLGLISISSWFIPVFLGQGYEDSIVLLKIFSVLVFFVSISSVVGVSYLISTNQQKVYTISVAISALVNLILNVFLIPKLFAVGAAIASITAEGIGCNIQVVYCCSKKQIALKEMFREFWKYLLSSIIMYAVIICIKTLIRESLSGLIMIIGIGIVVYFISLLVLKESLIWSTIKKLIGKIRKTAK